MNVNLIHDGYEAYLADAIRLYEKYRHSIETLLVNMNCKTESELIVGLNLDSTLSNELRNTFRTTSKYLRNVFKSMRETFFNEFDMDPTYRYDQQHHRIHTDRVYQKASAWYIACYKHENNFKLKILSFPWIVEDVLIGLYVHDRDFLSESIRREYVEVRDEWHSMSRFIQKVQLKHEISETIDEDLVLCGTYGLFLFESQNDIQLYVTRRNVVVNGDALVDRLHDYYDNVTVLSKDLIKCQHSDDIAFTIHAYDECLLQAFIYVRRTIIGNPLLLPVLYTIVHFIRTHSLFIVLMSENIKLDFLLEYFVDCLTSMGHVDRPVSFEMVRSELDGLHGSDNTVDTINEWIRMHDTLMDIDERDNRTGQVLIGFYKHMAFEFDFFRYQSKFKSTGPHVPHCMKNANFNKQFQRHFLYVFNQLVNTTSLSAIWESCSMDNGPGDESTPNCAVDMLFPQRFKVSQKKRGKSNTLFANEASLLTFSKIKSSLDFIEFQLYTGTYISFLILFQSNPH